MKSDIDQIHLKISSLAEFGILCNRAIKTAKSRIDKKAKEKAETLGVEFNHFWFHDLKRKGVSDTKGNKQEA